MKEKHDELYEKYLEDILPLIIEVDDKPETTRGYDTIATEHFREYKLVKQKNKHNFIDKNGKYLSKDWFEEAYDFNGDVAIVKLNGKWNFINKEGKYLSEVWFDDVSRFKEGYGIVKLNNKCNFIGDEGKYLSNEWYDDLNFFNEGFAQVKRNNKWNFINKEGTLLCEDWFENACEFNEGFAQVKLNGKWNYINKDGKYLSTEWFGDVGHFKEGYASVRKKGEYKWNYINAEGKLLTKEWYDENCLFVEGFAKVKRNGKYNFIDKNGKIISKEWFDFANSFQNGFAVVQKKGKYNFINGNGELISKEWFDYARDFNNGFAIVKKDMVWNFINGKGELAYQGWFDKVWDFEKGHATVYINGKYNYLDSEGKLLSKIWLGQKHSISVYSSNFLAINGHLKCTTRHLNGYQVNQTLLGYQCTKGDDTFRVIHKPIAIYGKRYALCLNNNNIVLYDRSINKYIPAGLAQDIEFDENFIYDRKNLKVFMVYNDELLDITKYYHEHLIGKKVKNINSDVKVISKNDFFIDNEDKIREEVQKEKEEQEKRFVKEKAIKEQQDLLELKAQQEKETKMEEIRYKEALYQLKKILPYIAAHANQTGEIERIEVEYLFIDVNDHKEINPVYIELNILRYIDLSRISFKNVKIAGVDFRGCNIQLFPQEVYPEGQPDLRGCNFEGLYIEPFMNFTNVDIRGAKFSSDNDPKTIDRGSSTFSEAIYDETTTFNGKPFTEIYGECEKKPKQK